MAQQNKAAFFGRKQSYMADFFTLMNEIHSKSGTTQTMVYVFLQPVADRRIHRVHDEEQRTIGGFSLQLLEFGKSGPKKIPLPVSYL